MITDSPIDRRQRHLHIKNPENGFVLRMCMAVGIRAQLFIPDWSNKPEDPLSTGSRKNPGEGLSRRVRVFKSRRGVTYDACLCIQINFCPEFPRGCPEDDFPLLVVNTDSLNSLQPAH
jgi:hypothetical protein